MGLFDFFESKEEKERKRQHELEMEKLRIQRERETEEIRRREENERLERERIEKEKEEKSEYMAGWYLTALAVFIFGGTGYFLYWIHSSQAKANSDEKIILFKVDSLISKGNYEDAKKYAHQLDDWTKEEQLQKIGRKTGEFCEGIDDCISKYNFNEARKQLNGVGEGLLWNDEKAKTKAHIKIITTEAAYLVSKKMYDKAETVIKELKGIDPKFFDNSLFGDVARGVVNTENYATYQHEGILIACIQSMAKDGKKEEAKKWLVKFLREDTRKNMEAELAKIP